MARVVVQLGRGLILPFPARQRRLSFRRIDWKSKGVHDAVRSMTECARAEPRGLLRFVRYHNAKSGFTARRARSSGLTNDALTHSVEPQL
jgi:hypothetical protein